MKHHLSLAAAVCCLFTFFHGCSSEHHNYKAASAPAISGEAEMDARRGMGMGGMGMGESTSRLNADSDAKSTPQEAIDNRKIIYSASLRIVVEDFDPVASTVDAMVKKHGGFIADANLGARNQRRRTGTWTVRIPVANFDTLLSEAGGIGIVIDSSRSAQDVSEEYVDIQARIVNKKKLETRIQELLERPDDKIQHVIEVEKELARVREDIERMEGRIRYLSDRIDLTTVSLSITEEKEPQPQVATSFTGRVSQAWQNSLASARRGLENFVVWIAGNGIGLLLWLLLGTLALTIIRRFMKKGRLANATS